MSNKLYALISLLAICVAYPLLSTAEPQEASSALAKQFSLAQAIEQSQKHNPLFKENQYKLAYFDGLTDQSQVLPNPQLTIKQEDFGGDAAELSMQSVIVTQPLELFNQRGSRIQSAKKNQELERNKTLLVSAKLYNDVTTEFYRVLGSYEEHQLTQESILLSQKIAELAQGKYEAGKISLVELNRAKILLSQSHLFAVEAEVEHHETERRLAILLALTENSAFKVTGDLNKIERVPSFEHLLNRLKTSPRIQYRNLFIDYQRTKVNVESSMAWPKTSVYFGVNRYDENDDISYQAGLSIDVPIFNRNQGNIRAVKSLVEQAIAERNSEWLSASHRLRDAYETINTKYEHINILKNEIIPRNKDILDSLTSSYKNGKISLFEVLDAQKSWLETRGHFIDTLIEYHTAISNIGNILGESVYHHPLSEAKNDI